MKASYVFKEGKGLFDDISMGFKSTKVVDLGRGSCGWTVGLVVK